MPAAGAYAVRCAPTGRTWVGISRNLGATKNGSWFCLRNRSHTDKSLQQEWDAYGEPEFHYEILETLGDDVAPLAVADLLKEKRSYWIRELNARPL